jgi:hypothetical protein
MVRLLQYPALLLVLVVIKETLVILAVYIPAVQGELLVMEGRAVLELVQTI